MHQRLGELIIRNESILNEGKKLGAIGSVWVVVLRLVVGVYWVYFSSQKWFDSGWVKPVLDQAANNNPIPTMRTFLMASVIPNWQILTSAQTILEAAIGIMLLVGLLTRVAGTLGAVLAFTLLATFLGSLDAPVVVWFYLFSALMSLCVAMLDCGKTFGIDGVLAVRWPNPKLPVW